MFEEQETRNLANNQRRSRSAEPLDRQKSRSPERSKRRIKKDKLGRQEDKKLLGPVSSNSIVSKPVQEKQKTIKEKKTKEDENIMNNIFTDAATQW